MCREAVVAQFETLYREDHQIPQAGYSVNVDI
jgi:hypothetical protein